MPVRTGLDGLDEMLRGGYPEGRTILASGTPGTGKSTLAMQFLQAGIDNGEQCLFVSTEQTLPEIRDSFSPFDFDLEDDNLAVTSIHFSPGVGNENFKESGGVTRSHGRGAQDPSDTGFVMRTLDGGKRLDEKNVRFSSQNVKNYLRQGAEGADRVVIDSVTGFRPLANDDVLYRRMVLELIQLFNREIGATALFTAESGGAVDTTSRVELLTGEDTIQFNVHGVIRLWREQIRGGYRRFIDVMKMRGIDHDTRRFEVTFNQGGLRTVPRERTTTTDFIDSNRLPTRIDGLDAMLGGGLVKGQSVLLEHDGRANIESFLYATASNALDQRMSLAIVPRVDTPQKYLDNLFDSLGASMDALLENDQLFILDAIGSWDERENVYPVEQDSIKERLTTVHEQARGNGTLFVANTEALVHTLGPDMARELRYWMQAQFVDESDLLLDVHNPALMDDDLAAFYTDAAYQVVDTWLTDHGLQYVQLQKGKGGEVGSMRIIEYTDTAPFIQAID